MTIREIMSTPVGKKLLINGTPKVTVSIARTPRSYLDADPDGAYYLYGEDVIGTVLDWNDPIVTDCPSSLITIRKVNDSNEMFFHSNVICMGVTTKYSNCLEDLQLASIITTPSTIYEKYKSWINASPSSIEVYDINGGFKFNLNINIEEDNETKLQKMKNHYVKFVILDYTTDERKVLFYI